MAAGTCWSLFWEVTELVELPGDELQPEVGVRTIGININLHFQDNGVATADWTLEGVDSLNTYVFVGLLEALKLAMLREAGYL